MIRFGSHLISDQIAVGVEDDKVWKYYDFGPKTDKVPLVFLPSVAGSASDYYKLILALSAFKRVISVRYLLLMDSLLTPVRPRHPRIGRIWNGFRALNCF